MRIALVAMLMALLAGSAARADVVSMPDKIELSGKKIEILEIREDEVVVRVAYGDITIPRPRVTAMVVDFEGRLKRLKDEGRDTPRALYALGRVCAQLEKGKEAAAAYREALAREKLPEDILLPMAADLEGLGAWGAACKSYQAYLKLHPDNADIQAKARAAAGKATDVVPEVGPAAVAGKIEIAATDPVTIKPAVEKPAKPAEKPEKPAEPGKPAEPEKPAGPEKPEEPKVAEGLEARPSWSTEAWGSSAEISVGAAKDSKDKMLRVWLAGAEKEKVNVMLSADLDLSKKKAMTFDVFNFSKKRIDISVAFINRPGWKFYESLPTTILPTGDTPKQVTVDLVSSRFKTADTKWRHKSPLQNADKILKMYFLLYTDVTGEWVFFNNIVFDPPDPPAAAGEAPKPPEAAQAERDERVARFMLRNIGASADKGEWAKAKSFLDRLKERYAGTKLYKDKRAEIDALLAKVEAQLKLQPKAPAKPKPVEKPAPGPKPAAGEKPAPAAKDKPAPEAEPAPKAAPAPKAEPAPKKAPAPAGVGAEKKPAA